MHSKNYIKNQNIYTKWFKTNFHFIKTEWNRKKPRIESILGGKKMQYLLFFINTTIFVANFYSVLQMKELFFDKLLSYTSIPGNWFNDFWGSLIIHQVVIYGEERWTLTQDDKETLRTFGRKVIRKIFGEVKENNRYNTENQIQHVDK